MPYQFGDDPSADGQPGLDEAEFLRRLQQLKALATGADRQFLEELEAKRGEGMLRRQRTGLGAMSEREMYAEQARMREAAQEAERAQAKEDSARAMRQLLHIMKGGRPERNYSWDPANTMPPAQPEFGPGSGMFGGVNGAPVQRAPDSLPPRLTPSVGVRG